MSSPLNREIICIVDDDEVYQFTASRSIKSSSVVKQVLIFGDGEKAYDYLTENLNNREQLPDVIFLDINMPYMDGWEFIDHFAKLKPNLAKPITVYMVSSSVVPDDVDRAKAISEITDYLIKPIDKDTFLKIIEGRA